MNPSRAALLALLLILTACNAPSPTPTSTPATPTHTPSRPHPTSAPGFDFYLLNLSWSPEFCYNHPNAPECAQHPTLVLHGLWPQNNDGSYPQHCADTPGPANPQQYADIYPDPGLLQHEWRTHGTCTGLPPDAFFHAARSAFHTVTVPRTLAHLTDQISMPPAQILGLVTATNPALPASSLALSCGNNFLTAIEVCLDKTLRPIACPAVRSCRANTVRIPPP